uniref:Uncharacterized protein n=1 Tax=Ditylenchus dipsaci TaxID=166011 RepID=A0A915D5V3_9BILA
MPSRRDIKALETLAARSQPLPVCSTSGGFSSEGHQLQAHPPAGLRHSYGDTEQANVVHAPLTKAASTASCCAMPSSSGSLILSERAAGNVPAAIKHIAAKSHFPVTGQNVDGDLQEVMN